MDECACLYGGFDECDEGGFQSRTTRKARKEYVCIECHQPIRKGDIYVRFAASDDGRVFSNRTCLLCEEIREALYCDGYYFGRMWEDIREQIFNEGGLSIACVEKLTTPAAKAFIQERWMQHIGVR